MKQIKKLKLIFIIIIPYVNNTSIILIMLKSGHILNKSNPELSVFIHEHHLNLYKIRTQRALINMYYTYIYVLFKMCQFF